MHNRKISKFSVQNGNLDSIYYWVVMWSNIAFHVLAPNF